LQQQDPSANCTKLCSTDLTISGQNNFCTTSDAYSINNLPTGTTVKWSTFPSDFVTINSPNSSSTTLTKTSDGFFFLKATMSSSCNSENSVIVQKPVHAGPPPITILGPYDPIQHTVMGVACTGKEYYFIADDSETGQTYTWTLFPPTGSGAYPRLFSGAQVQFDFVITGYNILRVTKTNSCGSIYTDMLIDVQACYGFRLAASPNPATDQMTVTIDEETSYIKALGFDTDIVLEMYNFNTGVRQKQWTFKNAKNQFTISLNGLSKGVYVLRATKGKYQQSIKVIVN
jgi:hypothetical protein